MSREAHADNDLPAHVIVLRPHCQADLALGFDTGYKSSEEVLTRYALLPLCHGKESAGYGPSRVDDRVEVRVVVVMDMRRDTVDQGSMLGVRLLRPLVPQQSRGGLAEERTQGLVLRRVRECTVFLERATYSNGGRLVVATANGTSCPVVEAPDRSANDFLGKVGILETSCPGG